MRESLTRLLDLFLPPACAGCGAALPRGTRGPRICPGCGSRLRPPPHPRCPRCHAPRGTGLPRDRPCPECASWPQELAWARSGFVLADPAGKLVHGLKYGGWSELGREMAGLLPLREVFPDDVPLDAPLVPVPTTRSRKKERGYNQARLLAEGLAERTGRPLAEVLGRQEGGETQVFLHPSQRQANVLQAFFLEDGGEQAVGGREVILVDDVLTTGATAGAAARVLVQAGALRVGAVAFARSLPGAGGQMDHPESSGVSGIVRPASPGKGA